MRTVSLSVFVLCLLVLSGCGDDDGGMSGTGATGAGSGGSAGVGGADNDAGNAATGGASGSGGTSGAGGMSGTGGAGGTAGTSGTGGASGTSGTGGVGGASGTGGASGAGGAASCMGAPSQTVQTTCSAFAVGPDCSPLSGCRVSGHCEGKLNMNDCVLRGVTGCGVGSGNNQCRVEPGNNFPTSAICVQTDRSAACATSNLYLQGNCLAFNNGDPNTPDLCKWVDDGTPTCMAGECEGYPVSQYCQMVDGCSWTN